MLLAIGNEGNCERRVKKLCGEEWRDEGISVYEEDVRIRGLVIYDLLHDIDYGWGLFLWWMWISAGHKQVVGE
jgi:hypothetical protein